MRDRDMGGYVFAMVLLLGLFAVGVAQGQIHYTPPTVYPFMACTSTACTSTVPLILPAGSDAAPSFGFAGATNYGPRYAGSTIIWDINGSPVFVMTGSNLQIKNDAGSVYFGATLDTSITRAAAGEFTWTAVLFAALGTPANGTYAYCSDCTIANPCAGSGTGALAKRLNGAWVCN